MKMARYTWCRRPQAAGYVSADDIVERGVSESPIAGRDDRNDRHKRVAGKLKWAREYRTLQPSRPVCGCIFLEDRRVYETAATSGMEGIEHRCHNSWMAALQGSRRVARPAQHVVCVAIGQSTKDQI